jgi:hypothetical protein
MASLGLTTLNELEIHEVDASPVTSGVDAPIGSLAIVTDGTKLFLKTGALATDWSPINSLDRAEYSYVATAVQTRNANTYISITQLTSEVLPVGFYKIEAYIICQSTATGTGLGLRIGQDTATIQDPMGIQWGIPSAGNGTDRHFQYDQTSPTDNINTTTSPVANTNFVAKGVGVLNVTTAGTIAVQLRSENTGTVSVRPNSILFVKAIQ